MSRKRFNDVIGMRNSQTQFLFADGSEPGWIDLVQAKRYPTLGSMIEVLGGTLKMGRGDLVKRIETSYFELPPVLDNFGFRDWLQEDYPEQYNDMSCQWSSDRHEIEEAQLDIYKKCLNSFPDHQGCYLYFLISAESGAERVIYVGKQYSRTAKGGMRRRFLHHTSENYGVKTDNYIGDCLNKSNIGRSYLSIRVKSAEMRRRKLCRVVWVDLLGYFEAKLRTQDYNRLQASLKDLESSLIFSKHKSIWQAMGGGDYQDPVNILRH